MGAGLTPSGAETPGAGAAPGGARRGVLTREEYFDRWSELHGGRDPRAHALERGWLTGVHAAARPFAVLRVPPDAVTLLGAVISALAVAAAAAGGRWVLAAAALIGLSGLVDGLDGAVAVLTGRTTAWGAVLDSVVDRVSDGLYLVALWVVGAPPGVCVAAGALTALQEYARARAAAGGMADVGVVTIAERPTRVAVAAMFLLAAGLYPADAARWAGWGAWVWAATAAVGLVQLLVVVRRRLGGAAP